MKAIILSGGRGTRLKPLTNSMAKQLIPVANRPIISFAIEQVREVGITDIGIVISPQTGDAVKEAIGDGSKWGASITYILQPDPLGLAHAVRVSEAFLGQSPFILHLGDTIIQTDLSAYVQRFQELQPDALILLQEVADASVLRLSGVAQTKNDGQVIALEEKPAEPKGNLVIVGIYFFSSEIHTAVAHIKPSRRGELEITEAIQELVNSGKKVHSKLLNGLWIDTGKKANLLEANQLILAKYIERAISGQVDARSSITGRVEIGDGTVIKDSTIQGPVSIAGNCRVRHSRVGPFASIGPGTTIEGTTVENSVVLGDCHIRGVEHLEDSIIGNRSEIIKGEGQDRTTQLFVGDHTRMAI